ncbi:MAG: LysR family transcriptional regulator [Rhodospirillales bacterium]|jgi:DNA-binding transcriptional LysR family regulator|nr:LysR family transcriptional regulator [Rhodospirillales bacterium]MBT4041244.1 LysR family transcriptional regulator [Rhodospirillales bacterium]MBT5350346.1 LysR family transcriptional regulator [Rhodospirillales bacterium]MBT5519709.1 LysR family transcriptional regulator [Rhodospirillales bacterium]MBT6108814.1 LysR family transcriptional regulator [Rhodospirillales bacterium]
MDWDKLRIFHAVADAGSFTHAGETLHLSQSAVSRQISTLEDSLRAPLFHRHARGLRLTEQGELLYNTAHDVFAKLNMVESQISEAKESPAGPLKITTTVAFGSVWLTSRMAEFIALYPDIDLSLVLADTELDLSMRQADVAIRLEPPKKPDLVQRHLKHIGYHVYATAEYLKRKGIPQTPEDLDNHDLVVYGEDAAPPVENLNWLLEVGRKKGAGPRKPVLKVNSIFGIFRAVQSGIGIGAIPDYMSNEVDTLVEVLPEIRGPNLDVYFVYPTELRNSARIGVFRDFVVKAMRVGIHA